MLVPTVSVSIDNKPQRLKSSGMSGGSGTEEKRNIKTKRKGNIIIDREESEVEEAEEGEEEQEEEKERTRHRQRKRGGGGRMRKKSKVPNLLDSICNHSIDTVIFIPWSSFALDSKPQG